MEEALVKILGTHAAVSPLITGALVAGQATTGTRVFTNSIPQNALFPQIVIRRQGTDRDATFDGSDGLAKGRFQIDAYAQSESAVRQLGNAIRSALDGYQSNGNLIAGYVVQGVWVDDETDDHLEPVHGDEVGIYWDPVTVIGFYVEARAISV